MTNAPLRISCVIPVFNGAPYLAESVESVLSQTHPPFEVIVVDDGSTDSTPSVAQAFGPRIRYFRQDNAGPAAARNRGVELAEGELVAFQDADDLWHPAKLSRQAERFVARPELDLSVVHLQNFWEEELAEEARHFADHPLSRPRPGYTAQAIVARRELFSRFGLLDPKAHHKDIAIWLIDALQGGAVMEVLPEVLVMRRIHGSNRSRAREGVDGDELLAIAEAMIHQKRRAREPGP